MTIPNIINAFSTLPIITDIHRRDLMGYSVADWALATLKWLDTDLSIDFFNREIKKLSDDEKQKVELLIDKNAYRNV